MEAPNLSLTDAYKKDPTGTRYIVVKNVTTIYDEEHIQLYFELICKCDVLGVSNIDNSPDLLLIEFSESINDIDCVRRRVQDKRLNGIVPVIEYLGCPSGLYITDIRTNVSKDMLELKFENKRSGGTDECVENIEFVHVGSRKHAYVQISDTRALTSILSIDCHRLENVVLQLQPYYQLMIDSTAPAVSDDTAFVTILALTSILSIDCHRLENVVLQLQPYYPSIHTDIWEKLKAENDTKRSEVLRMVDKPEQQKENVTSGRHKHQRKRPPSRGRQSKKTLLKSSSNGEAETDNENVTNLRVFYENSDNQAIPVPDISPCVRQSDEASSSHQTHGDTKPSSRSSRSMEKRPWRRNPRQKAQSCGRPEMKEIAPLIPVENAEPEVHEEMYMPSAKVLLLIIYSFQKKNNRRGFKVQLQDRNGKVIIKGHNENDIREAKLKIHECLDSVVSLSEPLSVNRHRFLSRSDSKNCIRIRSKMKNFFASFEVQDSPPELFCHAFNLQECREALKFVFNEITVQSVDLRPEHNIEHFEESIKSLINDLDKGLTTVYVDKSHNAKVVIESFVQSKAEDARKEIMKFLDNHILREKYEIVLDGARARCFEACVKSQLKRTVHNLSGKLDMVTLSKDPFKICVSVEGCERVISAIKRTELLICCEEVDFQKMRKGKPDELWLIYKGLNSAHGKDILSQFERLHKCFIDVVLSGTFVLPPKRSKVVTKGRMPPTIPDSEDSRCSNYASPFPERNERARMFAEIRDSTEDLSQRTKSPFTTQDKLLPRQKSTRPESHIRRLNIGGLSVTLKNGQIVNETADALVNIVSTNHAMGESVLSKEFIKKAGNNIILILQQEKQSCMDARLVIATDSADMNNCSTILHVALRKGEANYTQIISAAMKEILDLCESRSCRSVAIPPLGVGRMYKYPPETVIRTMLSAIKRGGRRNILQTITFVTYDKDTHNVFENEFLSFTAASSQPARQIVSPDPVLSDNVYNYKPLAARSSTYEEGIPRVSRANSRDILKMIPQRLLLDGGVSPKTKPVTMSARTERVSRFPVDKPIARLQVLVVKVGGNDNSETARDLVKKVEEEFLHEETLAKIAGVSKEAKQKVIDKLVSYDVKSFKVGDKYILKGQKDNVSTAYKEVLQILLDDKESSKRESKVSPRGRPGTRAYVLDMIDSEPTVPRHWGFFKPGSIIRKVLKEEGRSNRVHKIALRNTSTAYQAIHTMFQSNIELNKVGQGLDAVGIKYTRLNVIKIEKIENVELYEKFAKKRIELYQKLHDAGMVRFPKIQDLQNCSGEIATAQHTDFVQDLHEGLNEFLLFHGTKPELIEVISNGGFDERRGSGRAMFGQGIYGAEKSMKADQYTDSKQGRITGQGQMKYMFLMRMMLGNSYLCTNTNPPKYCRPPCTTCHDDKCNNHNHVGPLGHLYDSVTGDNGKLFREFVVYDRSLCYPEYIITYERI